MDKSKNKDGNITPIIKSDALAQALGVSSLYLKREDLHPLHSHKGRSIPYMIDRAIEKGYRKFAISSSGNAGIAAGLYLKNLSYSVPDVSIDIMIGKNINENKRKILMKMSDECPVVVRVGIHDRPLQAMILKTKDESVYPLRQSTDDNALIGYKDLWQEIKSDLGAVPSAIFIGTSSGTTAESISSFEWDANGNIPEIHIVQTSSCHPIYDSVKSDAPIEEVEEKSIADAIVDKTAMRKQSLVDKIRASNGSAWLAKNEDIVNAKSLIKKHADIDISNNSALSIVGVMHAVYTGNSEKWKGPVVCVICGE